MIPATAGAARSTRSATGGASEQSPVHVTGVPGTSVAGWPVSERPRERLARHGPGALSTRELLAVLIGGGGSSGSALLVADRILASSRGSLRRLAAHALPRLVAIPGVGAAKASTIQAAFELGRRADSEIVGERPQIRGPRDVFHLMEPRLRGLDQEEFHALLVNVHHRVQHTVQVTRGILDASLIHPREVFRRAILESAAGLILVHNHPSGDPLPSSEDKAVTRQLVEAGHALGIPVLDHVIVGEGRYASLAERGELVGV